MISPKVEANRNNHNINMREVMEKLLNDEKSRNSGSMIDVAAGENNFDTWD